MYMAYMFRMLLNLLLYMPFAVRCLVMQSFLDIEWERYKGYAQMVPRGFVLGPLIRGLNDVVHHKDFG